MDNKLKMFLCKLDPVNFLWWKPKSIIAVTEDGFPKKIEVGQIEKYRLECT